ncbi:MAG TPA: sigma 54-interacting transcriptional regulator [Gemmataceae bacterium]|nr:sigma 54-interacting transcriptional regulator [Gemmataceae bacterium]
MNSARRSRGVEPHPATTARQMVAEGSGSPESVTSDDIAAFRAIVEGTAGSTGAEFFQSLVEHLSQAIDARYAFIAEFADANTRVRTLAYWFRDRIIPNVEYDLDGTPCEEVVKGSLCHHPTGIKDQFTRDRSLVDMGIESYLGVPLLDPTGNHLGHLAVFDERPMPSQPRKLLIFRIFAARAAAELARLRLIRTLGESEQRYRDLYEQAPIAYVHEDLESRFISANRAALRILGLKPDEVAGTVGMSLVPDTPDAQRRAREAMASIGRGTDTSGVVLELRRKDNGRPVWIQWWSNPEPGGKYTRTMFVDITDRVLMEQEQARLQAQNLYLQEEIKSVHNFEEIIGQSSALTVVLDNVCQVAPTDASVLICGETGTGKELIARAIHSASKRKDKPLIKVNCAALPTGLVESELFGHEKGAFTGALGKRLGRFELANGGTIFLDEVGEIPLDVQAKLLRVLQEREFERVGGSAPIQVDVRVMAASNRDLLKAVRDKTFREDLYYRLNVFPIALPPLRQRSDDIPLLAYFFANKFMTRIGKRLQGISRQTIQLLVAYPWPGNIRELENILERAVILAQGDTLEIGPDLLPISTPAAPSQGQLDLATLERNHVLTVLQQTNWVIDGSRGAAKILGLHHNTLRSRMKKLGISRPAHEGS